MASRFQAAPLVASPFYPNAIAWSDENLIAVACGHLVTILNPALPSGPRGFITIRTCEPYPIGLVKREDFLSGRLLPTALSRDRRPCVRSISWSPVGMAPNSGCLLTVCTTEGRVKIYRPPFCDFCAEWIEVIDVSDSLYDYLANTHFGESEIPGSEFADELTTESDHASPSPNSITRSKDHKTFERQLIGLRKGEKPQTQSSPHTDKRGEQLPKVIETKHEKRKKIISESCSLPQITAAQYASRSEMLSSTVVAWLPALCLSSKICLVPENDSSHRFSILAVGGKSGEISIWRIHAPEQCSIEHSTVSNAVVLVGLLQAHNSWVTAVNMALLGSNSNAQVISSNSVPVSVLSIVIPFQEEHKMFLAVGKGSGSFEVWICDLSSCKFDKAGTHDAHDCIVTGLAWAFDGCCLYSCGQDNYVRCWLLRGSSFCEVAIPSNTLGLRSSTDLPDLFLSCLGVAVSPGNLVLAMVRNLDVDQLDHMYEGRSQKAVVEFFWNGAQQLDMLPSISLDFGNECFLGFSESELVHWESNILWSLKKFENLDKPLVIWDIIASLLAFKECVPEYVRHILARWLSMSYLGSHINLSINEVLMHISDNFSKISSRQLHLLNIICRRIVLSEFKADEINSKMNFKEPPSAAGEQETLWMELLFKSEKELRERLVVFTFSAFLAKTVSEPGYWSPVGVPQMEQWVELNHDHVKDQLKVLASKVQKSKRRLSSNEYRVEEQCSYCSASVPFNSPEIAFCQGLEGNSRDVQKHKLVRCAVSMRVCPVTPCWFCKCCNRRASKLAPESLFTMSGYPLDSKSSMESHIAEQSSKPLCPYCGILLQRLQPDFLLSISPV